MAGSKAEGGRKAQDRSELRRRPDACPSASALFRAPTVPEQPPLSAPLPPNSLRIATQSPVHPCPLSLTRGGPGGRNGKKCKIV
ncbi:hypothetical protein CLOSTASPAR_00951 [[Clostridium] asparagiforme DSM 15981]|uniref:Uncharacterized protein n=1 Tax=[Clostridium] asparagiforme DSM 15981 TaxID=518636 RepID=C0CVE8_9FIRM|nr:hypothetical protein CLOSTASPAR_00951 [[Clostridium] asparagiforme DSM 15981]